MSDLVRDISRHMIKPKNEEYSDSWIRWNSALSDFQNLLASLCRLLLQKGTPLIKKHVRQELERLFAPESYFREPDRESYPIKAEQIPRFLDFCWAAPEMAKDTNPLNPF